jgi:hypothetical protein
MNPVDCNLQPRRRFVKGDSAFSPPGSIRAGARSADATLREPREPHPSQRRRVSGVTVATAPADNVILALGRAPRRELIDALKASGLEVREVGDCVEPRTIWNAVHEGANAALEI